MELSQGSYDDAPDGGVCRATQSKEDRVEVRWCVAGGVCVCVWTVVCGGV